MRPFASFFALVFSASAFAAEPDIDRIRKHFDSDHYSVKWGPVKEVDPVAELEIGDGSGHGFTLNWWRFVPGKDGVDVVSIQLDDSHPYRSKWPPDVAAVVVKSARMKSADNKVLLGDVAMVDSAKPRTYDDAKSSSSSDDFWVHARVIAGKKNLIDLDWAGYDGSHREADYAKPKAAGVIAKAAIKGLDFKKHDLTEQERSWASAKFARDCKAFEKSSSHWWVLERSIIVIGVVGDASALPTLRDLMEGDPKKRPAYYAINAITRILKKDVREKPVEEMDIEKTRKKVLELLKDIN